MIRFFDLVLSALGLLLLFPLFALVYVLAFFDTGMPFFRQERVGYQCNPFILIKFRTMRADTISVATHMVDASSITKFGKFLRVTKLDELPQLWNVLRGEMSLVGPRPCLYSQQEVIAERIKYDVFEAKPGITGLAQIRHIDMSKPELLAKTDAEMLEHINLISYFSYILKTVTGAGSGDRIVNK